ncbi:MAG: hypothetical protein M3Y13_14255 [Armatimonadota bacterium]|nr:hypothetical protein [Armatimonadota bacterium]
MGDLIENAAQATEDKQLYDAFTELGSDPELSDVEFAFPAQAEVVLRD